MCLYACSCISMARVLLFKNPKCPAGAEKYQRADLIFFARRLKYSIGYRYHGVIDCVYNRLEEQRLGILGLFVDSLSESVPEADYQRPSGTLGEPSSPQSFGPRPISLASLGCPCPSLKLFPLPLCVQDTVQKLSTRSPSAMLTQI